MNKKEEKPTPQIPGLPPFRPGGPGGPGDETGEAAVSQLKRIADAQERIADSQETIVLELRHLNSMRLALEGIEKELQCICTAMTTPPPLKAKSATLTIERLVKKEN